MKAKLIVTILLLVFVAASLVALFLKGTGGEPEVERAAGLEEASRTSGGDTKIVVYYFHGNSRCKTCLRIEMYALEAIETGFPEALKENRLEFLPVNLEIAENEHFIDDFQLSARTVVVVCVVVMSPTSIGGSCVHDRRARPLVAHQVLPVYRVGPLTDRAAGHLHRPHTLRRHRRGRGSPGSCQRTGRGLLKKGGSRLQRA